jgi:beta-lactamase class A
MNKETAIVFCATFIGLFTSVIVFNLLIQSNLMPVRTASLADIDVQPEVAAASTTNDTVPTLEVPTQQSATKLATVVEKALAGSTGTYGIAIKNLRTGESYYRYEHKSFESASLYKLWVMAATYKQVKDGKLKESDVLTDDIVDLNSKFNIASESAERTDGSISLSVSSALQQMITISHNYSALLLTSQIKLSALSAFLNDSGLTESRIGEPPQTTASDTLKFFEKLYKGQLTDKTYTDKMLGLLKKQQLNQKLPKYLPDETVMAHKTGELDNVSHDAGIVYTPNGDYAIVILSDSKYPIGAEERIAKISKAVYNYFVSN